MIHAGKTPEGELQLILTGSDITALHNMIKGASLPERRAFYITRALIENEFPEYSK